MALFQKLKDALPKEKSKEELDEHYDAMKDLGKKDILAMIIAALITFVPVALIAMLIIYGLLYLMILS